MNPYVKAVLILAGAALLFYSGPIFIASILAHAFLSSSRLTPFLTATYGLLATWYVLNRISPRSPEVTLKKRIALIAASLVLGTAILGRFFYAQLAWVALSLVGGPLRWQSVVPGVVSSIFMLAVMWAILYHLVSLAMTWKQGNLVSQKPKSLLAPIVISLTLIMIALSWLSTVVSFNPSPY